MVAVIGNEFGRFVEQCLHNRGYRKVTLLNCQQMLSTGVDKNKLFYYSLNMSKKQNKTKRTTKLSTDLFVTTALQLAEEAGGLQNLSLRQLGKALNIDPTAVYRYFPSKDDLVLAMAQRILQDMLPNDEELAGDWRTRLTAMAHRAHRVFNAYPLLTIDLSSTSYINTPADNRLVEVGYQALSDAGLSDEHVVQFFELLFAFTVGLGVLDSAYGTDREAGKVIARNRYAQLSSKDFSSISRLASLAVPDSDITFQLGLMVYLNAIEVYANMTSE